MLARKTCRPVPSPVTATLFPFKSRTERIRFVANSSKQPTWSPARSVIGSPASTRMMVGAPVVTLTSTLPSATALNRPGAPPVSTYSISLKPSVRSRSSATN